MYSLFTTCRCWGEKFIRNVLFLNHFGHFVSRQGSTWLIWSLACIPSSFHTYSMISAVKWVPRSELTLKGSPNLQKMWFINRQAVVSAVSLRAGRHSIHFVNSQTTVSKYLLPRVDRGRCPTQSILRSDNGKVIPFLCSGAR